MNTRDLLETAAINTLNDIADGSLPARQGEAVNVLLQYLNATGAGNVTDAYRACDKALREARKEGAPDCPSNVPPVLLGPGGAYLRAWPEQTDTEA